MVFQKQTSRKALSLRKSLGMRTIIKFALFLVIGLLVYNYFYGTVQEREQSEMIVNKARDLGNDAWDLLTQEREKMRRGKYDDALEKLEDLYGSLRIEVEEMSDEEEDFREDLEILDERRRELERLIERGGEVGRSAREELDDLAEDTEELMNEMEEKSKSGAPW